MVDAVDDDKPELLSQADFARRHGVSRTAVGKWKAEGYLVFQGDKIDVAASDGRLKDARKGRFRDDDPVSQTVNPVDGAVNPVDEDASTDGEELDLFLDGLLNGRIVSEGLADAIKANALAGQRVLELRSAAGALIEFETAQTVLFEQARAYRDRLMNWPGRIGPLLAADLGLPADKVTEALVKHVHHFLAGLGEPDDESLRG